MLAGCSALRIGYATAPDFLYWWFDGYVDFDDAQTPRAREAIAQWFAWHRRTQLPDYAALLARTQADLGRDTTPERVCALWDEVRSRARVAYEQALPAIAELAVSLTPQQLEHLQARYAKNNAKYRDEFLQPDPAERRRAGVKRGVDRAESLYGRIDDAQRERIVRSVERSPHDPALQLAERRARQEDALALLRDVAGASPDRAQAALRAWAHRFERSPRDEYRRYAERLTNYLCAASAQFHNATSAEQRQAAIAKLKGWEVDLRTLAADAKP